MNTFLGLIVESTIEFFRFMYSDSTRWYRHSVALMGLLGAVAAIMLAISDSNMMIGQKSKTFEEKMARLKDTENALHELNQFIVDQRNQLNDSQKTIESLKREHETLQPMVETDRAKVDEILAAYTHAQSRSVWKERGIGFILGVVSSIVASTICGVAVIAWRKRKKRSSPTDAS